MEMSDDDLLASELSVGNGLPEFDPADVLGLYADDDDAFEEMWSVEGRDDEVADADADNALHLHVNEAVKAILCLNSSEVMSPLQEQLHNETPAMTKADDYTTSETAPRDDAQTTGEIDFHESNFDYNSDDSGCWSTEVNPPDDAEWCWLQCVVQCASRPGVSPNVTALYHPMYHMSGYIQTDFRWILVLTKLSDTCICLAERKFIRKNLESLNYESAFNIRMLSLVTMVFASHPTQSAKLLLTVQVGKAFEHRDGMIWNKQFEQ